MFSPRSGLRVEKKTKNNNGSNSLRKVKLSNKDDKHYERGGDAETRRIGDTVARVLNSLLRPMPGSKSIRTFSSRKESQTVTATREDVESAKVGSEEVIPLFVKNNWLNRRLDQYTIPIKKELSELPPDIAETALRSSLLLRRAALELLNTRSAPSVIQGLKLVAQMQGLGDIRVVIVADPNAPVGWTNRKDTVWIGSNAFSEQFEKSSGHLDRTDETTHMAMMLLHEIGHFARGSREQDADQYASDWLSSVLSVKPNFDGDFQWPSDDRQCCRRTPTGECIPCQE
jgi:hypothetical protein